ncbi:thylakoid lumenal 16.5 kDa protein chloroplastic [Phtheirospermum japonicum]|uniref:Thylakoid lumenal 16.5 kDa protein chloroplastic n=1 Tax=Phtheirospermum japonicum TaxID=374723 RepID=A0A830C6U6_9LAMI|nr:thylakoid lumenal 16.5 kDa protein chloroplastic [Phtheirospermum japonicum]
MASTCCSSAATAYLRTVKIVCKTGKNEGSSSSNIVISSRRSICIKLITAVTTTFALNSLADKANAAILEAEDDEELLEKVKNDRKKRLEKQGVISSSAKETAYLQDLVYKLSEIGKAIEKNDLSAASSVLGSGKDTEWVQKVNSAFTKLSSSEEEKTEVDAFNSAFSSLISTASQRTERSIDNGIFAVSKKDIEGSKVAFVECASAFEKWTVLSDLVEQLKGL